MKIRHGYEALVPQTGHPAHRELSFDPTEYADLLFGVGSATSAGPTLPGGSIHPSPETLEADCGGYLRNQPIVGFGHTYTSGSGGVKCYGNYLLAPMVDALELDRERRACFAKKGTEKATCYEYQVELENGIGIKMTPAHNAAIHQLTFPAGKEASFIFDAGHKLDMDACIKEGYVTVDPAAKTVRGGGLHCGNWNQIDWEMFFVLEFDADFEQMGIFRGDQLIPTREPLTVSISELEKIGAYVTFGTPEEQPLQVNVKVAISFVSVEKAEEFLNEQIPNFDYEKIRENARNIWRDTLGVIGLQTDDASLLRRFYTAMYHINIQPRNRVSDHGTWDDFHTIWDSWKTVFPIYSLLYPEKMGAIVDSFLTRAERNRAAGNGLVLSDEYVAAKEFLAGQGGNDIDNAIADAYLKGIRLSEHDWEDAYRVLLESAEKMRTPEYVRLGYATDHAETVTGRAYSWRCRSASATMGFAFNDKAIAAVAQELGTKEEIEKFEARSANWLNVWNQALVSEGFRGFPQNRNADGIFIPGFDPHCGYNTDFYEATAWDASYINYNDVSRLVEAMGGRETFIKRLLWACEHSVNYYNDDHGKEGYLNFTNEPSFQIPWLFCTDEIRRPDLAAKVIDGVIRRFSLPNDYPGDEDNGGMASYYVFLMCGFFPFSTTPYYYLHGTRVEKITFRLGNGNLFVVSGENVGGNRIYVQSATWRGNPYNSCKLTHKEILEGGELHFVMGEQPTKWGWM